MSRTREEERREEQATANRPWCSSLPLQHASLWGRMSQYLEGRGLSFALARANGWYPSMYDGEARIVIPATASDPTNRYWQARSMEITTDLRYDSPFAPRGDALIVVWPSSRPKAAVTAEGPMDALAAAEEGALGVGLMGMAPPPAALELVLMFTKGLRLGVMADEDALEASTSLYLWFSSQRKDKTLFRRPAPYKDLAEVPREKRREILR